VAILLKKSRQQIFPVFKRFSSFARQDSVYLVLVSIGILGVTLTNTALIWLLGQPVNILQSGQYEDIYPAMGILVAVLVLNQILQFATRLTSNWLGLRFVGRVRSHILSHILFLSFPVSHRYQKGDLLARISNDVDMVEDFVIEVPLGLVSHFLTLTLYATMIVWIDLDLALIALLFVPLFFLHQRYFAPKKGRASQKFFKKNGELLGFEEQSFANLRGISSFGVQSKIQKRHSEFYKRALKWVLKMRLLDSAYDGTFNLITYFCGIVVVIAGIAGVKEGAYTIGHLISFLLYLGYISWPVRGFAQASIQWQGDLGAINRITEILDQTPIVKESSAARELAVKSGGIEFKDVTFSFENDAKVFDAVNFNITAGETLALVGPSGSGKTTLARLLMRFYDPKNGQVLIDGIDIKQVTLSSLRNNIAVVWQDPFLISDTIYNNLLMAKEDATEDEVISACKASYSWDFIQELNEGLKAKIGDGGISLSVGQCQRLSIAQAFLKNAPILILDEASSALDSQSEKAIYQAVDDLRSERTTLIIAHRYSSLRLANRILYFNGDGTITLDTHEALLAKHSDYQAAIKWQTKLDSTKGN